MKAINKNITVKGSRERYTLLDTYVPDAVKPPVIIFCHGFKGYKDWGCWELMAHTFTNAGFLFIKFNYSFNGGLIEDPMDFPDLDAFAHNNYSIEVDDTIAIVDWLEKSNLDYDKERVTLLGHSRGGGISTLVAAQDSRIKSLITLAAVADFKSRFPNGEVLERWKADGSRIIKNARTGQDMPQLYQFYEDFRENEDQLDILKAAKNLNKKHLIIHAIDDPVVNVSHAQQLNNANVKSELRLLNYGGHTLGASHPYLKNTLPEPLQLVIQCCVNFLNH